MVYFCRLKPEENKVRKKGGMRAIKPRLSVRAGLACKAIEKQCRLAARYASSDDNNALLRFYIATQISTVGQLRTVCDIWILQ